MNRLLLFALVACVFAMTSFHFPQMETASFASETTANVDAEASSPTTSEAAAPTPSTHP